MRQIVLRSLVILSSLSGLAALRAAETPQPASNLVISGDLRARYEWDWDSQTAAGVPRIDRERARIRARLGFAYKLDSAWSIGGRLRTGSKASQQSPHLTVWASDGLTDDFAVQADKYFVQYKQGAFTTWGGRNASPFWQPDEVFWDEDVTPTGVAGSYEEKLEHGSLTSTVAALYMPDGAVKLNGTLVGGQVKYTVSIAKNSLTVAAGLYFYDGKDGAKYLLNRNGARDYCLGVLSAQYIIPLAANRPLTLGASLLKNFENYSIADTAPYSLRQADQTNGGMLSATVGQLKKSRDWLLGYFYADIQTFAVNASYSPDDWARFGAGPQALVTDYRGSEFRAAYAFTSSLNVMVRYFIVDAITTVQDGKRCRVDLNWKF